MVTTRILAATSVLLGLLAGCGRRHTRGNPHSWCEAAYALRAWGPLRFDRSASTRAKFLAQCVTLDHAFLACEARDWVAQRDRKCADVVRSYAKVQDQLASILFTGLAPGEKSASALQREGADQAARGRVATRGSDPCSQLCGKQRDEGVLPGGAEAVASEIECKRRCANHLALGAAHASLVDQLATRCLPQAGVDFFMCVGQTNQDWRKKEGNPEWCADCRTCTREIGCALE